MAVINDPDLEFLRIQFNKIESINSAFSKHTLNRLKQSNKYSQIADTVIGLNNQVIVGLMFYFMEAIGNKEKPVRLSPGYKSYSFTPEQLEKLGKLNEELSEILKTARTNS